MDQRFQCGHSGLLLRKMRQPSGSKMRKAISQRTKFSSMGEIMSCTTRPTTALPAHIKGAAVSKRMVEGESFCCMRNCNATGQRVF